MMQKSISNGGRLLVWYGHCLQVLAECLHCHHDVATASSADWELATQVHMPPETKAADWNGLQLWLSGCEGGPDPATVLTLLDNCCNILQQAMPPVLAGEQCCCPAAPKMPSLLMLLLHKLHALIRRGHYSECAIW